MLTLLRGPLSALWLAIPPFTPFLVKTIWPPFGPCIAGPLTTVRAVRFSIFGYPSMPMLASHSA